MRPVNARNAGLLIVNADDWGLTPGDTDAIADCADAGTITSATAMMWMSDSDRAAELARHRQLALGLHLNLIEPFSAPDVPPRVAATQRRVIEHVGRGGLFAHPYRRSWAADFERCVDDQLARFHELYGVAPTHFDGHRHMHLVANAMFARPLAPLARCRRPVNRFAHESRLDKRVARVLLGVAVRSRFTTTRWCFSIRPMAPSFGGPGLAATLAVAAKDSVEVIAHPGQPEELALLQSPAWREVVRTHRTGSFADLG